LQYATTQTKYVYVYAKLLISYRTLKREWRQLVTKPALFKWNIAG
jgi:hypothetical protein